MRCESAERETCRFKKKARDAFCREKRSSAVSHANQAPDTVFFSSSSVKMLDHNKDPDCEAPRCVFGTSREVECPLCTLSAHVFASFVCPA